MWIARNLNGDLYAFCNKPQRQEKTFAFGGDIMRVPNEAYPDVTWENSPLELLAYNRTVATATNNRPYVALK